MQAKIDPALYEPDKDMWIRATLFVVEGHWGEGTVADLFSLHTTSANSLPVTGKCRRQHLAACLVTSAFPPDQNKSQLQVARLARIEGRGRGFSDMILLNQYGRVAESTGACLVMVRDGCVITPPASEGRLGASHSKSSVESATRGLFLLSNGLSNAQSSTLRMNFVL